MERNPEFFARLLPIWCWVSGWNGRALRQRSITGRYSRHTGRGCGTSPSIKLTSPHGSKIVSTDCLGKLEPAHGRMVLNAHWYPWVPLWFWGFTYDAMEREETFESRGSEAKRKILCWTCGRATTHEVTWRFGERCYLCRDCGEIVVEKLESFQKE